MGGFITIRECKSNRVFIVETWGEAFYAACLEAVGETFLGLMVKWSIL